MLGVQRHPVPEGTALHDLAQRPGYYTDCFITEITAEVTLAAFVEAFYTTPIFKAERLVLRSVGLRSSDAGARQLAAGENDRFAAWHVTARTETQLLMKAIGRTSSWFMVDSAGGSSTTRLLFGSAVAPYASTSGKRPKMGALFGVLQGFHLLYSKLLLASARRRLRRTLV